MATIKVTASTPSTNITVQDGNNITATVGGGNNINLTVTPTPRQTIQINRQSGGGGGSNLIAGYPVVMSDIQYRDVVMFGSNQWNNVNQTEITDGGNY